LQYRFKSSEGRDGARAVRAPLFAVLAACLLGGCSLPVADLPVVGLPASTPPRPETPAAYLPVHDIPAPRNDTLLSPDEQARIEKDLAAARDRQIGQSAAERRND
jgi:hypothetical protein